MVDTEEKQKSSPTVNVFPDKEHAVGDAVTDAEKAKLLRKIDWIILPPVTLLFFLSFLDRSNIGNAKLENLATDLHMTGEQYLVTLSVFFVGYCAFEIPSNLVLKLTSPNVWLATLMFVWGIVATLMALSTSYGGLLTARFFLGATEAGVFPGAMFYLSMWYGRRGLVRRITLFWTSTSLAGAFGGILAYGIGHMSGIAGKHGWSLLRDYPSRSKHLSPRDQTVLKELLIEDNDALHEETSSWKEVGRTFKDFKVYLYMLAWFGQALPLYTVTLFLPTIIANLGYKAADAQLLTVPPYAVATVVSISIALLSERYNSRAVLAVIGYIVLLTDHTVGVQYLGTFFVTAGIFPASALICTWVSSNVSGQIKRCVATAFQISAGDIGVIIGCQMYRPNQAPKYPLGHGMGLGFILLSLLTSLLLWYLLVEENRRRDAITRGPLKDQAYLHDDDFEGDDDVRWRFIA
ncbi:major facilitator superfamily domain-containing protein [Lipomyces kononenkoae]|uniref:Major facilitator superfamily domain-containing protein n=1 Tax=Lipomyces kononenkoae TaxID=34357 RepID=A0ACC3TB36_LIPKO